MKRVLVLCSRDWCNPRSGTVEHYVHQVFARIAGQGHYIAWVAHQYPGWPVGRPPLPQLEIVDGIQIARMGVRVLYRSMVSMLLARLVKSGAFDRNFDAIVDCINGYPLSTVDQAPVPVVPLVFHLHRRVHSPLASPRPVIAATENARQELSRAGVPDQHIVRAPFGVDQRVYAPATNKSSAPTLVAFRPQGKSFWRALQALERTGWTGEVHIVGGTPSRRTNARLRYHTTLSEENRAELYRKAWFAYCEAGWESESLAMAACGVPVVCPATVAGQEFVAHDQTGLLFDPRSSASLAEQLTRLATDEVLRMRLSRYAFEQAKAMSWDKTASLVLATIENL